jgi:hypothetical protein
MAQRMNKEYNPAHEGMIAARHDTYEAQAQALRQRLATLSMRLDEHAATAAGNSYGTGYLADLAHLHAQLDIMLTESGAILF